jgi:hypothetical protein
MMLQIVPRGQLPAPRVIDDHHRANLNSLHNGLDLAPVLRPLPFSFGQQEFDRPVVVLVAALKEGIGIKKGLKAILRGPPLKLIGADRLWNKNYRKEKTKAGQQVEVIEGNNTGAVNGTAAHPHEGRISPV